MLENFKSLMASESVPKEMKISDVYDQWQEYCKNNIDKDNIENYDYEGGYINTKLSAEEVSSDWSDYEKHIVTFECAEDEDLNVEFMLTKWKKYDKAHRLDRENKYDLDSLRYLKEFDMFMMKLNQAFTDIIIDSDYSTDEVFVEYED